jgi:hypothetical protein
VVVDADAQLLLIWLISTCHILLVNIFNRLFLAHHIHYSVQIGETFLFFELKSFKLSVGGLLPGAQLILLLFDIGAVLLAVHEESGEVHHLTV